jgi:O6-methylguanine-DNA--protein-cysteine methyltransferase
MHRPAPPRRPHGGGGLSDGSQKEIAMTNFANRTYALLKTVPRGRVTTYKEIAHALGTKAYRGVGQAMKNNPYAPEVP